MVLYAPLVFTKLSDWNIISSLLCLAASLIDESILYDTGSLGITESLSTVLQKS